MAWQPTAKQMNVYETLLKQYRKVREQIIRVHKFYEKDVPVGRLPSLVVPKRVRKLSAKQFRIRGKTIFKAQVRFLRDVVSDGLKGYFKGYKTSYLDLYYKLIGEAPEIRHGGLAFYSEEQKALADPKIAEFMTFCNSLQSMKPALFYIAQKSGRIPAFKFLYAELSNQFEFNESWLEQAKAGMYAFKHLPLTQEQIESVAQGDLRSMRRLRTVSASHFKRGK